MQFGRGTALDKMAVHLNAWAQGQNKEGILGGMLRLCQSRQDTEARPGGSTETGRGQPSIVQAQSTPYKWQVPCSGFVSTDLASGEGRGQADRCHVLLGKDEVQRVHCGSDCCHFRHVCRPLPRVSQGPSPTRRFSLCLHSLLLKVLNKLRVWFFSPQKEAKITDSSDTLFGFCLLI